MELGIPYISVYAFSIENYKRSQEEVAALMKLSSAAFNKLLHVSEAVAAIQRHRAAAAAAAAATVIGVYLLFQVHRRMRRRLSTLPLVTAAPDSIKGICACCCCWWYCFQDKNVQRWQAELRVVGDLSKAPAAVQAAAARMVQGLKEQERSCVHVVNICFSYT
jgi:undecaprenyl pyrophosphate synthase